MRLRRAHPSHQDHLILTLSSMFTVPNLFGAWQRTFEFLLGGFWLATWALVLHADLLLVIVVIFFYLYPLFFFSSTYSLHPASAFARWNSYSKRDNLVSNCCSPVWTSEIPFPWSCGKKCGHSLSVFPKIVVRILLAPVGPSPGGQWPELLWQSCSMACLHSCPRDSLRSRAYSSVLQRSRGTGPSPGGPKIRLLGNFRMSRGVCSQAPPATSMRWTAGWTKCCPQPGRGPGCTNQWPLPGTGRQT